MRRTRSTLLAISVSLLLAVAPCTARTRPHYGSVLRVQIRAGAPDSDQVRSLVAESLTALDEQGRVLPSLADHWESQNGGRRWQFTLHPHVTLHDGTPLTAKLVAQVLSSQHALVPWRSVQGVNSKVVFDSDSPVPNLPALLASADFAIASRAADGTLIGSGPFRISAVNQATVVL